MQSFMHNAPLTLFFGTETFFGGKKDTYFFLFFICFNETQQAFEEAPVEHSGIMNRNRMFLSS